LHNGLQRKQIHFHFPLNYDNVQVDTPSGALVSYGRKLPPNDVPLRSVGGSAAGVRSMRPQRRRIDALWCRPANVTLPQKGPFVLARSARSAPNYATDMGVNPPRHVVPLPPPKKSVEPKLTSSSFAPGRPRGQSRRTHTSCSTRGT
jgi:hypothetical protein